MSSPAVKAPFVPLRAAPASPAPDFFFPAVVFPRRIPRPTDGLRSQAQSLNIVVRDEFLFGSAVGRRLFHSLVPGTAECPDGGTDDVPSSSRLDRGRGGPGPEQEAVVSVPSVWVEQYLQQDGHGHGYLQFPLRYGNALYVLPTRGWEVQSVRSVRTPRHDANTTAVYEQRAPGFNASVPVLLNFTSDTPCWFNVRTGPNGIDGENSATFNLLGEERSTGRKTFGPLDISEISSSSSLAPSSPAPSLSPSPSSPSSTDGVSGPAATDDSNDGESSSSTTSTPNSSQDTSSARGSLSAGASAGVGIGAGIGVIAVAAVACWYLRRRRNTAGMEISGGQHPHSGGGGGDGSRMEQYFYTGPAGPKWKYGGEFGAVHRPVEIATSGPNGSRTHHEMMA